MDDVAGGFPTHHLHVQQPVKPARQALLLLHSHGSDQCAVTASCWRDTPVNTKTLCFRNSSGEINEQSNNNPIFPWVNTDVLFLYGGL
jgi:predicted esterase